jgi:hypothetical protein
MFEILGECIDVCGNLMTEAQIRSVFEAIKAEIGEREERMKGRLGTARPPHLFVKSTPLGSWDSPDPSLLFPAP